jgi:hypothetical protein
MRAREGQLFSLPRQPHSEGEVRPSWLCECAFQQAARGGQNNYQLSVIAQPTKIMLHCTREAVLEKINDSGLFDFFGARLIVGGILLAQEVLESTPDKGASRVLTLPSEGLGALSL